MVNFCNKKQHKLGAIYRTFCIGIKNANISKNLGSLKVRLNKIDFMYCYEIIHVNFWQKFVSKTCILDIIIANFISKLQIFDKIM